MNKFMAVCMCMNILVVGATLLLCSCTKNEAEPVSWEPLNLADEWQISEAGKQNVDSIRFNNQLSLEETP